MLQTLPMIDVLVLDEADRMIADGHFKEMRDILAHIYTQRLKMKTGKKGNIPKGAGIREGAEFIDLDDEPDAIADTENFYIGKNLEGGGKKIEMGEIQDLIDEEALFKQMKEEGNIIMDQNDNDDKHDTDGKKRKVKTKSQREIQKIEEESFVKEYQKAGGIQHIICSATLTIDKQGRVTPRSAKREKKLK